MAYINDVRLLGNLGKDPELRYTSLGKPVANFSLATTKRWKNKTTSEQESRTSWHNIVLWGRQAEIAQQYLKKGSLCYVAGELISKTWEDSDGIKRFQIVVEGSNLQLMPSGEKENTGAGKTDIYPPEPLDEHLELVPPPSEDDQMGTLAESGDEMPF